MRSLIFWSERIIERLLSLTMVAVHTLASISHDRIVESRPQLYAYLAVLSESKTALETALVCDFKTARGDFRFGASPAALASPDFFLRFRSRSSASTGTSSSVGTLVSHSPIKLSRAAVRRCEPDEDDATDVSAAE